jgi:lipopolysaccharide biosynthesis regulator YciM
LYQRGEVARAIAIAQELVEKNPQRADLKAQLEKFSRAAKPKRRR